MSDTLFSLLKATLCDQSNPVFFWRRQNQMVAVAASNLWTLALHRRHELRSNGLKPDDIWYSPALDFSLIVDLVACAISGNPFFPYSKLGDLAKQNGSITDITWNTPEENVPISIPRSFAKEAPPCLIHKPPNTRIATILNTSQVLSQIHSTLNVLRPSANEIRLSCLKPHDITVLINDVLCGMLARQTIYIDFEGESFQHPDIFDKVTHEEDISTLAIGPSICSQLAMTPPQIKERFNLKTVYSVETLEVY
jgi:hypothetical protein